MAIFADDGIPMDLDEAGDMVNAIGEARRLACGSAGKALVERMRARVDAAVLLARIVPGSPITDQQRHRAASLAVDVFDAASRYGVSEDEFVSATTIGWLALNLIRAVDHVPPSKTSAGPSTPTTSLTTRGDAGNAG